MKYLIIIALLLLNQLAHAEEDDKPDVLFDGAIADKKGWLDKKIIERILG